MAKAALKRLKVFYKAGFLDIEPKDHVVHIKGEGDRSFIILHASTIESIIEGHLRASFDKLDKAEVDELFSFDGPIGTFSNKTRVAQALGIISRQCRKKIDIVRTMRNVAAHVLLPVTFATQEIRDATRALLSGTLADKNFDNLEASHVRDFFGLACVHIVGLIGGDLNFDEDFDEYMKKSVMPISSVENQR